MFIEITQKKYNSIIIPNENIRRIETQCDSGMHEITFCIPDRDVKITVDSEDYNRFFACLADPAKRLLSIADITVKMEAEKEDQQVALACA